MLKQFTEANCKQTPASGIKKPTLKGLPKSSVLHPHLQPPDVWTCGLGQHDLKKELHKIKNYSKLLCLTGEWETQQIPNNRPMQRHQTT